MFYLKLAWNNLKSSKQSYAPFVLASLVLYSLTLSLFLIMTSPMEKGMDKAAFILPLGIVVLAILSIVMEIYSYQILLKQRSREFGLYNILGMNKRQVGLVASLELGFVYLALVTLGSLFSAIFANFLYLIFVNIVHYDKLVLTLSPFAFILNALLFAGIFLILLLVGWRHIGKTSPLSLFKTSEKGEREPRGNRVLALASLLFLGVAYGIALYFKDLSSLILILLFFVAVILVILGTYLFYISFMAWFLKKKRGNKAYFYQPQHFISTSQMIFRMKANAAGLASITLLAVMAFVSIGTTVALYANTQNLTHRTFIRNTKISRTVDSFERGTEDIETYLHKHLGKDREVISYTTSLLTMPIDLVENVVITRESSRTASATTGFVCMISQKDFKKLGNDIPELAGNQVIFYKQKGDSIFKKMNLFGQDFEVVENLKSVQLPEVDSTYNGGVLVVANQAVADHLRRSVEIDIRGTTSLAPTNQNIFLDTTSKEVDKLDLMSGVLKDDQGQALGDVVPRQAFVEGAYAIFGGMLFTGVLLGAAFLLGAALIIYYKQYSEGQEDKKSYKILQEVGMSTVDIKKTISSQTLLVFFMPLGLATLHYIVAIPMLRQMLLFFGVSSGQLVYQVAGLTTLSIGIVYFFIYKVTSRTYYKLVER